MKLYYVVLLVSIAMSSDRIQAAEQVVNVGTKVVSPNGRFTLTLMADGNERSFSINDKRTGQTTIIPIEYSPVLALKWTPNSNTIVTVEHVAGGSIAGFLHFNGSHWVHVDAPPPESNFRYMVTRWVLGDRSVHLVYKVENTRSGTKAYDFSTCAFDVNPETGDISNLMRTPLSEMQLRLLKTEL